jgi:ornithine carbamoyltransferase
MRHLISLSDLSNAELAEVISLAEDLKEQLIAGNRPELLKQKAMGLLFEKKSLRTRVSFETLMIQTGGSSLFLGDDVGWGKREPIEDFIPILTSYVDILVMRANEHATLEKAAKLSRCPVINALTDRCHPCQAIADLLTVKEQFGTFENLKIAYVGDANNVAYSLAQACVKLGVEIHIACPKEYQFDSETIDGFNGLSKVGKVIQSTEIESAVENAVVVYSDVWASMGQESERQERVKALGKYQVDSRIMALADEAAIFMHCLPARRGEEVTSDVIDGKQSQVIKQAENRLHAQKGLVVWMLTNPSVFR